MARILICTPDIIGPVRNGGIGTAYFNLCFLLQREGYDVSIAYVTTTDVCCEDKDLEYWSKWYLEQGITFHVINCESSYLIETSTPTRRSFLVYEWLNNQATPYDIIHFPEWGGVGYTSILAKLLGLAFTQTRFIVETYSPTLWNLLGNGMPVTYTEEIERDYYERFCVEYADVVVSPSKYMLEWMKSKGWRIAKDNRIIQNIIPGSPPEWEGIKSHKITELVFFGRLEKRKGIVLFLNALKRSGLHNREDLIITFLGNESEISGDSSSVYIAQFTKGWKTKVQIETTLNRDAAISYLGKNDRLAVMPSLLENSPFTVLECLLSGIAFIASDVGGIRELIDSRDHSHCLTPLHPGKLGDLLKRALDDGQLIPRLAISQVKTNKLWGDLHEEKTSIKSIPLTEPLVSVILVHHDRPKEVQIAIQSLKSQTYKNFEVILVDAGSSNDESIDFIKGLQTEFDKLGWKIIFDQDRYLGAARNLGATHAQGKYLMFMDDDNVADTIEIETFVKCAENSQADILTCAFWIFSDKHAANGNYTPKEILYIPSGGSAALGMLNNHFGDANAFIRHSVFEESGGFIELYGFGIEDYELFARLTLENKRLYVVPQPLFYYKRSPNGMLLSTDIYPSRLRVMQIYADKIGPELGNVLTILIPSKQEYQTILRLQQRLNILENLLETPQHKLIENLAVYIRSMKNMIKKLLKNTPS